MFAKLAIRSLPSIALWIAGLSVQPELALSHCDGMDGPVVKAAQMALEKGDANLVLVWVQTADEGQIRSAFERTLAVRKLGPEAQKLADMYFFEMLVRVHRAGEGAPYTGLKPAGRDLGPAIPAADKALETGDAAALTRLITDAVQAGVREHFQDAAAAKGYSKNDVQAGRKYVQNYVTFVHFVEGVYQAATHAPPEHAEESQPTPVHEE